MTEVEVKTIYPNGEFEFRVIDHDRREDRQWLGKHAFLAPRNGVEIRTKPMTMPPGK